MDDKHVINCNDVPEIDMTRQDGGLEHKAGVYTYQIRRSCRTDGDYTYNHAPMLTAFNNRLVLSYISGKRDEHGAPDEIVYTTSKDGCVWDKEKVLFPYMLADTDGYTGPDKELLPKKAPAIVHFRMCFYKASNGKLIATTFYGFSPDSHRAPNNGYGAARLVREVYKDYTLSDMYIIKYNEAGGFNGDNTIFYSPEGSNEQLDIPYYVHSSDKEFVKACDELLSKKLILEQLYEEEMYDKSYKTHGRAVSLYEDAYGNIVGLCKKGEGYLFDKEGNVLIDEKIPSLITNTAKVWGQKTPDGNYIICYNPTTDGSHRWPLAVMESNDGREYYNMKALIPEIPPYKYQGNIKNLGAQYMRGICSYNGNFDKNVWITYSCNKEDIWISKLTKDNKYSIMKPLWCDINYEHNPKPYSDRDKFTDYDDKYEIIDRDACARAIIEYFPQNKDIIRLQVEVDRMSDDNGVKVQFVGKNNKIIQEVVCIKGNTPIEADNHSGDINSVIIYSKNILKLNTIDDDGRYSTISDMPEAERKDYYIQFKVLIF